MALSEPLFVGHVRRWAGEYPDNHPDMEARMIEEAQTGDWDSPTDFMEDWVKREYPNFYNWWVRNRMTEGEAEREVEAYEQRMQDYGEQKVRDMAQEKGDEGPTLEDRVVELCGKNAAYARFLRHILAEERAIEAAGGFYVRGQNVYNPMNPRPEGWELSGIQRRDPEFTGGHVAQLERYSLVFRAYDSQQYHLFRLADREAVERALASLDRLAQEERASAVLGLAARDFLGNVRLTDEDGKRFEALLAEGTDPLDYWFPAVAPKIVTTLSVERAKKAALLTLASTDDRHDNKNRIHTILHGPPETAKSRIAYAATAKMGGVWAAGRSTKVGLTADASQGDLTPGALPRAHKRPLGVDELDKFSSEDQSGLLEGMEEGRVTINIGKFVGDTLDAEALVIATANEIEKLKPELLSRFDFAVEMSLPTTEEARDIASDLIEHWDRPKATQQEDLAKFLKWVRQHDPQIPQSVRDAAKKLVGDNFIALVGETRPRKIESVIRIAKALARLSRRDVTVDDVRKAMLLSRELNRRSEPTNGNGNGKKGK